MRRRVSKFAPKDVPRKFRERRSLMYESTKGTISKRGSRRCRLLMLGCGNVGIRCLELLLKKPFRDSFVLIGVADSSGGVLSRNGIEPEAMIAQKKRGRVVDFEEDSIRVVKSSQELYDAARKTNSVDIVIDLTPVNLKDGEPSLGIIRDALSNGVHCVLANKAPLALSFSDITQCAREGRSQLAYSATVCGGLPVVNVAHRDLVGATFTRIEGIFNSTSNFVLSELEKGKTAEAAIETAQKVGIAEADPKLDIEGFDTANKLVILANTAIGLDCTLKDVKIEGIQNVTKHDMDAARERQETIRLIATCEIDSENAGYTLTVAPRAVSIDSFFGRCDGTSMNCRFATDIYETIEMQTDEKGVYPTSAAVLRDCFGIFKGYIESGK